jgi:hypothetical protein
VDKAADYPAVFLEAIQLLALSRDEVKHASPLVQGNGNPNGD